MIWALIVFNSLCVWRFPDRDLKEIFNADAYETKLVSISEDQQAEIEKRLGAELDPDETEFKFFMVTRKGEPVGIVSTHLSKGQYGAIEVVVGFVHARDGNEQKIAIKAVRIQRDREKAHAALRGTKFLDQFIGMTSRDKYRVGDDIKSAQDGAEKSSQAVAFAVKKIMIVYDVLFASE
jgi:hypothetical protein